MLICNNCLTQNEDGAKSCYHCNMIDNFTQQSADNKSDDTPIVVARVICRNCGSDTPGDGIKCGHCQFPLPVLKNNIPSSRAEIAAIELSQAIHLPSKHQ